jgi:Ser/Thr protein kinase RdoA (MazF antagonist)
MPMTNEALADQEQQWIDAATRAYGLAAAVGAQRVSDPEPISRCHIFSLISGDDRVALKVYPMGWWPDRLYRAHVTAEFLHDRSFPAPRPLRTVEGERILFLGERPAICTTWVTGAPIWDPHVRQWDVCNQTVPRLQSAAASLALQHRLMADLPFANTRVREFPAVAWFSTRLGEAIAMRADGEGCAVLGRLGDLLAQNAFPEPTAHQHVLVDCHPGQFLFEGAEVTGVVDFDHVATASPIRDLGKFFATDAITLSAAADCLPRYLANNPLTEGERELIPAGILRYILTSAIQRVHKAVADQVSVEPVCEALCADVAAFSAALRQLKAALGIKATPSVPADLSLR